MLKAIFWKEWRQQAPLMLAILAIAGTLLISVAFGMPEEWARRGVTYAILTGPLLYLLMTLAIAQGVVTGSLLFAGEKEEGTQDFLDQHSAWRLPLWRGKMLAGTSLVLVSACILGGLIFILGLSLDDSVTYGLICIWLAVEVFVWSTVCSTKLSTTFGTIGVSLVVLFLVSGIPSLWLLNTDMKGLYFLAKVPALIFALVLSHHWYCSTDENRSVNAISTRWIQKRYWTLWTAPWIRVCLWQVCKRRWVTLAIVFVVPSLFVYVTRNTNSRELTVIFYFGTFLIGCIAGWAVFADEQASGVASYLGDQRIPGNPLWLGKTLPMLGAALLAYVWAYIVACLLHHQELAFSLYAIYIIHSLLFFVLSGFAFALFLTQYTSRMSATVFLTIALGMSATVLWVPSLFYGMSFWRAWVIPFALLLASRLNLSRWTSGRLYDRRGILNLALLTTALAGWLGGNLWWRAIEIPDPGEPFDTDAYWSSLLVAPNPHGQMLVESIRKAEEAIKMVDEAMLKEEFPQGMPRRVMPQDKFTANPLFFKYIDTLFQSNDWEKSFRLAASASPDRLPLDNSQITSFIDVAELFLMRAAMHPHHEKQSLADLDTAFAAIRHGLHETSTGMSYQSLKLQNRALTIVDGLLQFEGHRAEVREKIAEILARHDQQMPRFVGIAKSTTFTHYTYYGVPWVFLAPWEKCREERHRRVILTDALRQGEANRFTPPNMTDEEVFVMYHSRVDNRYTANISYYRQLMNSLRLHYALDLDYLRCLRLAIIAMDFEAKTGKQPSRVEDLDLPNDLKSPFVNGQFTIHHASANQDLFSSRKIPHTGRLVVNDIAFPLYAVEIPKISKE